MLHLLGRSSAGASRMGGHAVECERCNEEGKMDDETDLKQIITGMERQGRRVQ
jgi:hypothetical protein